MASVISNFEDYTDRSPESNRKKRRRIDSDVQNPSQNNQIRWRSALEQQSYSAKLIDAIRHVRRSSTAATPYAGSRAVRDAADKALAVSASNRHRWSRAILSRQLKLRLRSHKKVKAKSKLAAPTTGCSRSRGPGVEKQLPPLEKRVRTLGRLVPGCRKLSFPNLLVEATDYIAALQMQVRTMTAIAEILTGSTSGSSSEPVNGGQMSGSN